MIRGGNGAGACDPSPGRADVELRHHPLSPFAVDGHPAMVVRRLLTMHDLNLLFEGLVFGGLLPLALDVLTTDAQRCGTPT